MFTRAKSIIIVLLLLFNALVIISNFGPLATDPANNMNRGSGPRSNGWDWSDIEVISEPLPFQNNNTGLSQSVSIAAENGKIYVVWQDGSDYNGGGSGDWDVFYRYFDGSSWSEIQVISEPIPGQNFNTGNSYNPDITVENGKVYVVWEDDNATNGAGNDIDIFFLSNLTGSGWEPVQIISEPISGQDINIRDSKNPCIKVNNGNIYAVWDDGNITNGAGLDPDIFYRCNLTGSSWEQIQVVSEPVPFQDNNIGGSIVPRMAIDNNDLHLVWMDYNDTNSAGTDTDIFYKNNISGSGWSQVQILSEHVPGQNFDTAHSTSPCIAVENNKVYVVWHSNNDTNGAGFFDQDIFYKEFDGTSWLDVEIISEPVSGQNFNTGVSMIPCIDVKSGNIYVVWADTNNTNGAGTDLDVFYKYKMAGSNWEDVQVISEPVPGKDFNTGGNSGEPKIIEHNDRLHVFWRDNNNTNGAGGDTDIFYKYTYGSLKLLSPIVTPISGNTSTYFNFTVKYFHKENTTPTQIVVNISGTEHSMIEADTSDTNYIDGKGYFFNITHLDIGIHKYKFWASDGVKNTYTTIFNNPTVYNTAPNITTLDNETATEDTYYEVQYEYEDIDVANVGQSIFWNFSSNASWLMFDNITAILNGTPTQNDMGDYWVNITINDTLAIDFTNFTFTLIEVNDDPMINTTDIEITYEDELYQVDYNATDIDSPIANQVWSLDTNATAWLGIDTATGVISGTPTNDDVGEYWVNVSVVDGHGGDAYVTYTLIVLNVNDRPEITTIDVLATNSNILYSVDYNATDIDSPLSQFTWTSTTNATWLGIDAATGVLSGTPTDSDAGWFNVNVTVDDGDGGQDWNEFILVVIPGEVPDPDNDPPVITTIDKVTITAGESYNVVYEATDDRTPVGSLLWSFNSDAGWLSLNKVTRVLSGSPTLTDVGTYWVNVTVGDGEGKFDSHNFTVTVYETANLPPDILTADDVTAVVDELYSVDYEAEDDRTPVDYLQWSLKTNATWLTMHMTTGILSGTPDINDVGSYIVNVTVFDGEDGWDFHNFILTVTSEPIDENNAPELSDITLTPSEGDVETEFTFTVHYYDEDADAPSLIKVFIDNGSYDMTLKDGEDPADGIYSFSMKLSEGNHTYYFTASDGKDPVTTGTQSTPFINKVTEVDGDKPKSDSEENWWIWVLIIVIIIIVVLVLLFLFVLKKKPEEEPTEEERLAEGPPPVPVVEPEQPVVEEPAPPTEEPQVPEVPPEQVPAPEVPPEQVPVPETPPPDQPPPTPEVTPQVEQQPQEPVPPQPAPVPQTTEQPVATPQVEQPQAAPQETAGAEEPAAEPQQPQVPTVKEPDE